MNENGNDRIRVMEILNRSQYNDEVIDGLDMSDLDLTFSDLFLHIFVKLGSFYLCSLPNYIVQFSTGKIRIREIPI